MISKIISGGQAGAERAGLDLAIRHNLPCGGWCPKGRRAEDGPLGGQYLLEETSGHFYSRHTEWNVRDSDATVIITLGPDLTHGSLKALKIARKLRRPYVHISGVGLSDPSLLLEVFAVQNRVRVLNIAGSRESEDPGIYDFACFVLEGAFFRSENQPCMLREHGAG